MISNRNKRTLLQILPFGIIPGIFSVLQSILEKGTLGNHPIYPSTGNLYEFSIIVPFITSLIIGFCVGFLEIFYISKWFEHKSFFEKIFSKSIIYAFFIVLATVIIIALRHSISLQTHPFDKEVISQINAFFKNFVIWSILCYYSFAVLVSLYYYEVNGNIGQNISLNFFTGKYNKPIEEERIFIFLDMKSSTTIAEKLGHLKYFQLLKEYYADLSGTILDFDGEIYQYVGDEVVVTWKFKNKSESLKSIICFFEMQKTLADQSKKYQSKYGVIPTFKAGIHMGKVTTGEIGKIKKDFVFTGDVLNTTARIQALCNTYETALLLSNQMLDQTELINDYKAIQLGETNLRGRDEKVILYTLKTL